jgi:hypothetical protein
MNTAAQKPARGRDQALPRAPALRRGAQGQQEWMAADIGKNTKEAIRALKRQLSNVIYRIMVADAHRLEQ